MYWGERGSVRTVGKRRGSRVVQVQGVEELEEGKVENGDMRQDGGDSFRTEMGQEYVIGVRGYPQIMRELLGERGVCYGLLQGQLEGLNRHCYVLFLSNQPYMKSMSQKIYLNSFPYLPLFPFSKEFIFSPCFEETFPFFSRCFLLKCEMNQ